MTDRVTTLVSPMGWEEWLRVMTVFTADVVTWQSDRSTNEDLSGVVPMNTGAGAVDWTKEPEPSPPQSPGSSWADFTHAFSNEGDGR